MSFSNIVVTLFIFCYLGEQVTQRFKNVAAAIYQLDWHLLPTDVRKYMPIILAASQKEIYIRGFGSFHCRLWVFKKVVMNYYQCVVF